MLSFLKSSFSRLSLFWLGIVCALLFAGLRGTGMLLSHRLAYLLPLGFMLMMLTPFFFLNSSGKRAVGFASSQSWKIYLTAILSGGGAALACYGLGLVLFGTSDDNWFVTIRNFYINNPSYQPQLPKVQLFLIFTIPALIFSPIGEEIFFRGFLHLSLQQKFPARQSTFIDSSLFAIVHLFHHGILLSNGTLKFHALSGFLWVMLMFSVSLLFSWLKARSNSIYPPIVSHAVFNLVMNATIFYGIGLAP